MQRELDGFFRSLRIKWIFDNKPDKRTELETKFYKKSNWSPPKAGVELEKFISDIQRKFDRWKPPRWIKDNISESERKLIKSIKHDKQITYMWEDKGPSFTKMRTEQYLAAGEHELNNEKFYAEIEEDPTIQIK